MDPNDILRMKAEDVVLPLSDEDRDLLQQMLEYVRNTHDEQYCEEHDCRASVGIALVNPRIIANSVRKAYLENGESCLSVNPDVEGYVPRYFKITVRAYNLLTDRLEDIRLKGYPSIVMQHEIDHLYGKLYYDHINQTNPWQEIADAVIV